MQIKTLRTVTDFLEVFLFARIGDDEVRNHGEL